MDIEKPSEDVSTSQTDVKMEPEKQLEDCLTFKVVYDKAKYDINMSKSCRIEDLKIHMHQLVGVPKSMQKLIYKGILKDDQTLAEGGLIEGCKIMLVGSKPDDILSVTNIKKTDAKQSGKDSSSKSTKEPLCRQKSHKKVIDKGMPEDVTPGILALNEPLPTFPLSGMLTTNGRKVRMTFKLEIDQIWISTKDQTVKVPMTSIKGVVSEPIDNYEQYHIMGLQMGTTEGSKYWVYWMPAQYVESIKEVILGKWQFFFETHTRDRQ